MKKKFVSFFIIFIFLLNFISPNVWAAGDIDDPLLEEVLMTMEAHSIDNSKTIPSSIQIIVSTIYAMLQIAVIGGILIWATAYSTRFFSSDAAVRSRAKDTLGVRLLIVLIALGIDGMVTVAYKYFLP